MRCRRRGRCRGCARAVRRNRVTRGLKAGRGGARRDARDAESVYDAVARTPAKSATAGASTGRRGRAAQRLLPAVGPAMGPTVGPTMGPSVCVHRRSFRFPGLHPRSPGRRSSDHRHGVCTAWGPTLQAVRTCPDISFRKGYGARAPMRYLPQIGGKRGRRGTPAKRLWDAVRAVSAQGPAREVPAEFRSFVEESAEDASWDMGLRRRGHAKTQKGRPMGGPSGVREPGPGWPQRSSLAGPTPLRREPRPRSRSRRRGRRSAPRTRSPP